MKGSVHGGLFLSFESILRIVLLPLIFTSFVACTKSSNSGTSLSSVAPGSSAPSTPSNQFANLIPANIPAGNGWMQVVASPDDSTANASTIATSARQLAAVAKKQNGNGNGKGNADDGNDDGNSDHGNGQGDDNGNGDYGLHKNPTEFSNVYVTVAEVSAYSQQKGWVVLNSTPETVDLIQLSYNAAGLLANHELPIGNYALIRLTLTGNSSVVVNGKTYPLKVPSKKIDLVYDFSVGDGKVVSLTLKFDPDKSIHREGNGRYTLIPVIAINGITQVAAPDISITSPSGGLSTSATQTVTVNYDDDDLDLSTLSILIDGQESKSQFTINSNDAEAQITFVDGAHTISASISDTYKNVGNATPVSVLIDTPPVISNLSPNPSKTIYSTGSISVSATVNKPVVSATVAGVPMTVSNDGLSFSGLVPMQTGQFTLNYSVTDVNGVSGAASEVVNVVIDDIPPVIQASSPTTTITNQPPYPITVQVTAISPTTTQVLQNGVLVFTSTDSSFTFPATLEEGANLFEITSTSAVGLVANPVYLGPVVLDTNPPILTNFVPVPNATVTMLTFPVSALSNIALTSATLNGQPMTIGSDGRTISLQYTASVEGQQSLTYNVTDIAGNSATISVPILVNIHILNPPLLSVAPDPDGTHLDVVGAPGAATAGVQITANAGFFNSESTTAAADGSFILQLSPFTSVTVTAYQGSTNRTESATLSYGPGSQTLLSGTVKDTSGNPLPGVTVSISGTDLTVQTGTDGVFTFNPSGKMVTGDQTLVVNGNTVPQAVTGTNKVFGQTSIAITIGLSQSNVLQTPIYLSPQMQDGVTVSSSAATVVTYPAAPGVEIDVPAGTAVFPPSAPQPIISMQTISAQYATVPPLQFAKPNNLVDLEPSGLSFTQPVDLTLPNDNKLPAGVQVVIMSMNSAKGAWEIDGVAQVDSSGQFIKTLPGMGITHFSSVYASPVGPKISQLGAQDVPGTNVLDGSMSTSIKLPSFKSMGQDYTPSLTYNSAWAKPTVLTTDVISVPKETINLTRTYIERGVDNIFPISFYTEKIVDTETAWWQPDSIDAQFSTTGLAGNTYIFSGVPNQALLSYSFDVSNLPSGVYPYTSHWELHLAQMVIGTVKATYSDRFGTETSQKTYKESIPLSTAFPQDFTGQLYVQNETASASGIGWRINGVQKILNPKDNRIAIEESGGSISSYAISNSIETAYQGKSGDLLGDGVDLSHYPEFGYSSDGGASGKLFTVRNLQTGSASTPFGALPQSNLGIVFADDMPAINGIDHPSCDWGQYTFVIQPTLGQSLTLPDGTPVLTDSRYGMLIGIQSGQMMDINNNTVAAPGMLGIAWSCRRWGTNPTRCLDGYGTESGFWSIANTKASDWCSSKLGFACGTDPQNATFQQYLSSGINNSDLNYTYTLNSSSSLYQSGERTYSRYRVDYTQNLLGPCSAALPAMGIPMVGSGFYYQWGYQDGTISGALFNSPMGMTFGSGQTIVIADSGNHMIRQFDTSTNTVTTIAGNGTTINSGDGGPALSAGIRHPRGVAYDQNGNLYVSSGDADSPGFIRKIDTNGNISTLVGSATAGVISSALGTQFSLNQPTGIIVDNSKNILYVADTLNNRVVAVDLNTNMAQVIAGGSGCNVNSPNDGAAALNGSLCGPTWLGFDDQNNLLVVDAGHNSLRRIVFSNFQGGVVQFASTTPDNSTLTRNADGTFTRFFRNGTNIYFDANGNQTSMVDRIGNQVQFQYDSNNRLTQMTNAVGQTVLYSYSGSKLTSITDPAGRTTSFDYNGDQLSSVIFPDGTSRSYSYDSNNLLTQETDQRGYSTQYAYNAYNRLHSITRADGGVTTLNDIGSQTIVSSSTDPSNLPPIHMLRQVSGTILSNGNQTTFNKDINGYVSQITDVLGHTTTVTRDLLGNATQIQKPDGSITDFTYDPNTHDLLSSYDESLGITESQTYDSFGNILTKTDGRGLTTKYAYFANSNLVQSATFADGSSETLTYDQRGLPLTKSIPLSSGTLTTSYGYDQSGNQTSVTLTDGKQTTFTRDLAGNVITYNQKVNSSITSTTQFRYDVFNRTLTVISPKNETTKYAYDYSGNLLLVTDSLGKTASYSYDSMGRPTKKTDQFGSSWLYTYNSNGNLFTQTDPNGNVQTRYYNALNQVTGITYPDDSVSIAYDPLGNISQISNNVSVITESHNSRGWLTSAQTAGTGTEASYPTSTFNYTFDADGNVTSASSGYGSITYNYSALNNRLSGLSTSWGQSFGFAFDNAGRLIQIIRSGGVTNISYLGSGAVNSIQHLAGSTQISYDNYSYDLRNIPLSKSTPIGSESYVSDLDGQLTSSTGVANETFFYDALGNRLSDTGGSYTYDPTGQRLTEDWQYTYTYDKNGNMVSKFPKDNSKQAYSFTYSSKNQLIEAKVVNNGPLGTLAKTVAYAYDVLGRRIEKKVVDNIDASKSYTRRYIYNDDSTVAEVDDNNTILSQYSHSPLAMDDVLGVSVSTQGASAGLAQSSGSYFFLKDAVGSITDIIDGSGNVIQRNEYSAYGTVLKVLNGQGTDITTSPTVQTPYLFTGRELDRETGLYYYRARFYDPATGRFCQQDPYAGKLSSPITTTNRYAYTGNQPINRIDPSGQIFGIDDFAFIGGLAAIGGIIDVVNNGWTLANFFGGALQGAGLAAAVIGAASVVGAVSGFFGNGYVGAVAGLANPGTLSSLIAVGLALPAAFATFDPNTPSWTNHYASGFFIFGALGNFSRAALEGWAYSQMSDVFSDVPSDAVIPQFDPINGTDYGALAGMPIADFGNTLLDLLGFATGIYTAEGLGALSGVGR